MMDFESTEVSKKKGLSHAKNFVHNSGIFSCYSVVWLLFVIVEILLKEGKKIHEYSNDLEILKYFFIMWRKELLSRFTTLNK
jgi:hypothetical protein